MRLAVGTNYRGQNLGRLLLMDAFHRSRKNTSEVAAIGVAAEASTEPAKAFYLHHEFFPLLDHPNRLFLAMPTVEKAFTGESVRDKA